MLAPHWHPTGMIIMYILRGSGRMQAVYPGGKAALRKDDLKQGDYIALPANYPSTVVSTAVLHRRGRVGSLPAMPSL